MTECLSDETLAAYVDGRVDASERRSVETHLVRCDRCLEQVALLKRVSDDEAAFADLTVPPAVLARARALIAERFGPRTSIVDLVVRIAGSVVEVLRTTGEMLAPDPASAAVRGRRKPGRRALVRKRVGDLDLIIEVESRDGEPVLRILLNRPETGHPVHGVRVDLAGSSDSETRFTEKGLADFGPRRPDRYRVRIEDVGDIDLEIQSGS